MIRKSVSFLYSIKPYSGRREQERFAIDEATNGYRRTLPPGHETHKSDTMIVT